MAYGVKYFTTWKDNNNNDWKAEILERDITGVFTVGGTSVTNRLKLTIDNTKVAGDLTNYLLYVDLADMPAGFWSVIEGSGDIRATKINGQQLPAYIGGNFSIPSETGSLWIRWDGLLPSSVDTELYLYFGGADTLPVTDTYGRNNVFQDYEAFWDFEQDPAGTAPQLIDLTGNGNDGTSAGGMATADLITGKVGNAWGFDNDEYASCGRFELGANNLTIGGWAKWTSTGARGIFGSAAARGTNRYGILQRSTGEVGYAFSTDADEIQTGSTANDGTWKHLAMTVTRSAANGVKGYLNGSLDVQGGTPNTTAISGTDNPIWRQAHLNDATGDAISADRDLEGDISASYLRFDALSANHISTEYANQNSASTFYTVGAVEASGTSTEIVAASNPCVIRRGSSTENKFEPIIGSECTLNVMVNDSETFRSLIDADEEKYLVLVKYNDVNYWVGHLTQDTWVEDYTDKPYKIRLRAIDGLVRLKQVDANGTFNFTLQTVGAFIAAAIGELEYLSYFEGILESVNVYENSHNTTTSDSPLLQTQIDRSAFYKDDRGFVEYTSYYDALSALMTTFGCRLFTDYEPTLGGIYFYIQRVAESTSATPEIRRYNTSYTYVNNPTLDWTESFSTSQSAGKLNEVIPINQAQTLEIVRGVPYAEIEFDPLGPRATKYNNGLLGGYFEDRSVDSDWASTTALNDWSTGGSAAITRYTLPASQKLAARTDRYAVKFTTSSQLNFIDNDTPVVYFEGDGSNTLELKIRASYEVPTFTDTGGLFFTIEAWPVFKIRLSITDGVNTYYLEQSATTGVLTWIPATPSSDPEFVLDGPAIVESEFWIENSGTATTSWDRFTEFSLNVPTPPIEGDVTIQLYNLQTSGASPAKNQRQISVGPSYEDCKILFREVILNVISSEGISTEDPVLYRVANSNAVTGGPYTSKTTFGDARNGAGLNRGILYDGSGNLTTSWNRRGETDAKAILEITVNDHLKNYLVPTFKFTGDYRYGDADNLTFCKSYAITDDGTRYMLPYYWEQNLERCEANVEFMQNGGTFTSFVTPTIGLQNPLTPLITGE